MSTYVAAKFTSAVQSCISSTRLGGVDERKLSFEEGNHVLYRVHFILLN